MHSLAKAQLLAVALFATSAGLLGADENASATKEAAKSAATAVKEKAKKGGSNGSNLQELIKELNAQRDSLVTNHEALAKQMKDATEEQKKALRAKMKAELKEFEEHQAVLHKAIRDEQRKQRQAPAGPKR